MESLKIEDFPHVPQEATFSLQKIEKISVPHPFCITPKHVSIASDYYGGMLGKDAIEDAEKKGIRCGVPQCNLRFKEHEQINTLFILLDKRVSNLNQVPLLNDYLMSIKEWATERGIEGFAFPHKT